MCHFTLLLVTCAVIASSASPSFRNTNFVPGRSVIVHLFEWKWSDIADECERFLAPMGYAGVQVSPVTENVIVKNRPWYERYQPISYKLTTRSGDERQFADMVRRCNAVGVRIYVDVVFNHMTGVHDTNIGTGGSTANSHHRIYPAVPYNESHFNNPICGIENFNDPIQARNCELVGLRDLNHTEPYVREKIVDFLNHLIDLGVAGFRVDAAKHMWPHNLHAIYSHLKTLNTKHGFSKGAHPYITQEVIDLDGNGISRDLYTPLAPITEFRHSAEIGRVFRGHNSMHWMRTWGTAWGFVASEDALVFVDNHDNQRDHADKEILSYRHDRMYRMATAWVLAHPFGNARIMSSFAFPEDDFEMGPPHDANDNILSPVINDNGQCVNGWVCEHRWPSTANMVQFRIQAGNAPISHWYDNHHNQVAFGRNKRTFIAFNNERSDFNRILQTDLPAGVYCDIISGGIATVTCQNQSLVVNHQGFAHVFIPANSIHGVIAVHVGPDSKLI